jgi:hypothetical protein
MPKFSSQLEDRLQNSKPGDVLDVILEVADEPELAALPASKPERYEAAQEQFETRNQSVTKLVEDAGGEVLGQNWLNSAVKVRIPVDTIQRLLASDQINLIDIPHRISRG